MTRLLALFLLAFALLAPGSSYADPPPLFPVQGVLTDADGVAIDGTVSVRLALYDAVDASEAIWEETKSVVVTNGAFAVHLGDTAALDHGLFADHDGLWLGITVDADDEMDRVELGSTGYASVAQHAIEVPGDVPRGDQNCSPGDVVVGIDESGLVVCASDMDQDTLYTGLDFALSNQTCLTGDVVLGIDATGAVLCAPDTNTTYSGADFALSNQTCQSTDLANGLDASGTLQCVDHAGDDGAHHSPTSDGLALTPLSVTIQGTSTALTGGQVDLGPGSDDVLTAAMVTTLTGGGQADSLHTHAAQAASTGPTMMSLESTTGMTFGDAARYCRDLVEGGFSDWMLPDNSEFWSVYQQSVVSNPNSTFHVWTTDRGDNSNAYWLTARLNDGDINAIYGGATWIRVRCVR